MRAHQRTMTTLGAAGVALTCGHAAALGQTIADLAPENAVVVMGVNDFSSLRDAADRAGLLELWNEPSVQAFLDEQMEEALQEFQSELQNLGFTMDDLSVPAGTVGLALFVDGSTEDARYAEYHYIAVSDFGDNAEQMHELVRAAFERQEEDGGVTIDEDEYNGVTILTLERVEADNDADGGDEMDWGGDDWDDWDDDGGDPWPTMYYANPGSMMIGASNLRALESAIEKLSGDDGDASVQSQSGWATTMRMLGDEPQAYVLSVTAPWFELASGIQEAQERDADAGGMVFPMTQMIAASGLGEVQGFGMGMNLDEGGAVAEWTFAVAVPELNGLLGLIPTDARAFEAPNFASADAVSVGLFQVQWDQLLPAIREIAFQLPQEQQQQTMMGIGMAEGFVGPLLANLGPEVYTVQELVRPYSATSAQTLIALRARDEGAIRQSIQQLIGMSGMPLETREFQGATIWSMPEEMAGGMGGMGGMMGMAAMPSLALGEGYLFFGQTDIIENSLRAASGGAPRLADDESFQQMLGMIQGSGLSWSWSDMESSMEYLQWMVENMDEIQREQLRALGMTDEEIEQQLEWMGGGAMGPMGMLPESMPDLTLFSEYVGDSIGFFETTEQGIVGTFKTLKPQ